MSKNNGSSYGKNQGKKQNLEDFSAKLIELHNQNLSLGEIGKELGFASSTVSKYLTELGITKRFSRKINIEMISDIEAVCSECKKIKSLSNFFFMQRSSKNPPYYFHRCMACEYINEISRATKTLEKWINKKHSIFKSLSKSNGIPFEIDRPDLIKLYETQKGLCFYSDIEMTWTKAYQGKKSRSTSMSIDKIIPSLGYIEGNTVFCVDRVNAIKSDAELEEIRAWMPFLV